MKTSNHTIRFWVEGEYEDVYWVERHLIALESSKGEIIRLTQDISHSKQMSADLFYDYYPFVVEYYLNETTGEENERFIRELFPFKKYHPLTVKKNSAVRLGFTTLEDTMEFTSTQLEVIKRCAIKSVTNKLVRVTESSH